MVRALAGPWAHSVVPHLGCGEPVLGLAELLARLLLLVVLGLREDV